MTVTQKIISFRSGTTSECAIVRFLGTVVAWNRVSILAWLVHLQKIRIAHVRDVSSYTVIVCTYFILYDFSIKHRHRS